MARKEFDAVPGHDKLKVTSASFPQNFAYFSIHARNASDTFKGRNRSALGAGIRLRLSRAGRIGLVLVDGARLTAIRIIPKVAFCLAVVGVNIVGSCCFLFSIWGIPRFEWTKLLPLARGHTYQKIG